MTELPPQVDDDFEWSRPSRKERPDLYECAESGLSPGSPTLCDRCLEARSAAGQDWIGPWYYDPTYEKGLK